MAERNTGTLGDHIQFRIGINVGDVVVENGDIFGDGVNVAACLEALSDPGGICVSARVQEDAAGRLDLAFEDLGEQSLKNIARPVRVYRVHPGRTPHDLPTPIKGLIALGPDIVCEGEIITFTPAEWELHLERFEPGRSPARRGACSG